MAKPTENQQRALWVAYFILGVSFPLILWNIRAKRERSRHREIDEARDTTVEDSFPASDPPSSW